MQIILIEIKTFGILETLLLQGDSNQSLLIQSNAI